MQGNGFCDGTLQVFVDLPVSRIECVRFWSKRQIDGSLRKRKIALRRTDEVERFLGSDCHRKAPGSARPISSLAMRTMRRARYKGSSPDSSIRASQYSE